MGNGRIGGDEAAPALMQNLPSSELATGTRWKSGTVAPL